MNKHVFINLPIADLAKSQEFFRDLGYMIVPEFTNEQAACLMINKEIYVMLVTHDFFKSFSTKEIADASRVMEVQLAFSAESKEDVDAMAEKAKAAGSPHVKDAQDEGFMYSRGFEDLDHHLWDYVWMDPTQLPDSVK